MRFPVAAPTGGRDEYKRIIFGSELVAHIILKVAIKRQRIERIKEEIKRFNWESFFWLFSIVD